MADDRISIPDGLDEASQAQVRALLAANPGARIVPIEPDSPDRVTIHLNDIPGVEPMRVKGTVVMSPLERVIGAINNTTIIKDIAGDQQGVIGTDPLHVVVNPEEVARAVLHAIREPSDAMTFAGGAALPAMDLDDSPSEHAGEAWQAMIDTALAD